jgi:UDP-N-acetyl-D-glucosamine/UDP-N-acetyl-D-galactosamine dehydrogenase
MTTADQRIAVVGLGYVGIALAAALGRNHDTVGFDVDSARVGELSAGDDRNRELDASALSSPTLSFTDDPSALASAGFIIVAVPTPVYADNEPDLTALRSACQIVGEHLRKGATVVFESTVYPGCTEDVCIPALEQSSGLTFGQDFSVGYSPERIDPGDGARSIEGVVKVIAANDGATLEVMAAVYGSVVEAGLHRASSIRVGEAAKVIENIQRDLNIALMNELSVLFHKMDLPTHEVLEAAGTKWNFLPFYPGLVGGHCIPVDPYYLVHKARSVGHEPDVIVAGRNANDGMPRYIAEQLLSTITSPDSHKNEPRALVLGATFKENVRDFRNSGSIALTEQLRAFGAQVDIYDPLFSGDMNAPWVSDPLAEGTRYDIVALAVPHQQFSALTPASIIGLLKVDTPTVFADLRGKMPPAPFTAAGVNYWRL